MSTPNPSAPPALLAKLDIPWVRHALAFALALLVPALLRVLTPAPSPGTGLFSFLALAVGLALMLAAVALYGWWLHTQCSNRELDTWNQHWRLGRGPTGFSRHPAWLAVLLFVLGQALIGTTAWLLAWAVLVIAALEFIVRRHDEPQLARAYGAEYAAYAARVSRWLPWKAMQHRLREVGQLFGRR
jgi:protein-S-isoprenylcysteine O-methyltransferase Ste14